jgi:REP element-mobilizing transposase RayT
MFGEVMGEEMKLNDAGRMVWKWWNEIDNKFEYGRTDQAIIMPNHFHGIIFIIDHTDVGVALRGRPKIGNSINTVLTDKKGNHTGLPQQGCPNGISPATLYDIMGWFKTMTTNEYIRGVKQNGWKPFPGKLWQRNYFDRIIRNETELNRIREYIVYNPLKWESDRENPGNLR